MQRSRLAPFVKTGRTIRTHRHGILAAIPWACPTRDWRDSTSASDLIMRRPFGFHTAKAAFALVRLSARTHKPHSARENWP
ncbi:MAG: transposase [Actinomycetota bacterium]|nr:transposase [Actinomycetota bacterium]